MFTSDPSGQFYFLQCESSTQRIWKVGRGWAGRLISDSMSYRNHYMRSGEATSKYKSKIKILSTFPERASKELAKHQSNLLVYRWTYTKRQVNA